MPLTLAAETANSLLPFFPYSPATSLNSESLEGETVPSPLLLTALPRVDTCQVLCKRPGDLNYFKDDTIGLSTESQDAHKWCI